MVDLLLRHCATVNPKDRDDKTPFQLAVVNGHADVIKALRRSGGTISGKDPEGRITRCRPGLPP
jgi:ankyrin repeat protein